MNGVLIMPTIKPRNNVSLSKAREYVKSWAASGLSQAAFCFKLGYSESSIHRWLRRIKQADAKALPLANAKNSAGLQQVVVQQESVNASSKQQVEICLPNNTKLRFPSIVNPQQISALLRELQSCS